MLYFEKSQPAPDCLENEKIKASGDYKCGCVLERLKQDFRNKCYICESSTPQSINVEHFRPHQGNIDLKFSWENLFWSCAHCNNIKLDNFNNILNCTKPEDYIENRLEYSFNPFPHEHVKIIALDNDPATLSTKNLVEAAFNGTTKLKTIEAANMRNNLLNEIVDFQKWLIEYFKETCEGDDKELCLRKIRGHLHPGSSYVSFKRWIIRKNELLIREFGRYFQGD